MSLKVSPLLSTSSIKRAFLQSTLMMRLVTIVIPLLSFTFVSTYHKAMTTFVQKCSSKCSKQYCHVKSVCRPVNRTSKLISVDVFFHSPIEAPIYIDVMAYKKFTTLYRPFMIKFKEELCGKLSQKDHYFHKAVDTTEKAIGNLLRPCPFSGHRFLSPRYSSDETFVLPLIPVGEWKFELSFSTTNVNGSESFICSWAIYYEIKASGAEQF